MSFPVEKYRLRELGKPQEVCFCAVTVTVGGKLFCVRDLWVKVVTANKKRKDKGVENQVDSGVCFSICCHRLGGNKTLIKEDGVTAKK